MLSDNGMPASSGGDVQENQVILVKATRDWLAEQRRQDDIRFREMMKEVLEERRNNTPKPGVSGMEKVVEINEVCSKDRQSIVNNRTPIRNTAMIRNSTVKSPSDTTIYAPALQRCNEPLGNNMLELPNPITHSIDQLVGEARERVESAERAQQEDPQPGTSRRTATICSAVEVTGRQEAQDRLDQAIIDGEKFEAEIADPPRQFHLVNYSPEATPGANAVKNIMAQVSPVGQTVPPPIEQGISDDDFFHLMCHVNPTLFKKIEAGEFVDLDKLLPKERLSGLGSKISDENRMEWVQRDRGTYLVPANRDSRINGFRKWEQAFRVYATIYCGANPQRAKEIWQYISVINTAANAYQWDNVYNYDITFRRLMAFNPNRSWATTYNQMWNLSMCDPLPKNFGSQHHTGRATWVDHSDSGSAHNQHIKIKPDYCWNFNKGIRCNYGKKCKFIERCSYCDSTTHGVYSCHKLQRKMSGGGRRKSKGSGGHHSKDSQSHTQESSK